METENWDAIIIGGGVAGLSAALMLGRARRRVLVIDAEAPRNRFAAHMHGVLGNEGVNPVDLLERGRGECAEYGVQFAVGTASRVEAQVSGVEVQLSNGDAETARALVVASGVTDELPDIPGLAERWGSSVFHCPYCHGWEVRDQKLGMLATPQTSPHQIEMLRQWSDRVVAFTHGLGEVDPSLRERWEARGIEVIGEPVSELLGEPGKLSGVRLRSGREVEVEAILTTPVSRTRDDFLAGIDLARTEMPFGSGLTVDMTGKTSHPRIWAAGNVTMPPGNVPLSMGAGAMAGGGANMMLIAEDFDVAVAHGGMEPHGPEPGGAEPAGTKLDDTDTETDESREVAPAAYWDERYGESERMWSGRPNAALIDAVQSLRDVDGHGTALDLGCGEGADTIWLAQQGWRATGVDISGTAIARAEAAARSVETSPGATEFIAADLTEWGDDRTFDLVTASFLHSTVSFPRAEVLRRAAERVAPRGHLVIVSHATMPPWARDRHQHEDEPGEHEHAFLSVEEEIAQLALDRDAWTLVIGEARDRDAVGPDGERAVLQDNVIVMRRA